LVLTPWTLWPSIDEAMESARVFVVDDDPLVLRALERMLRTEGFAVEVFASATALLERLPYDGVACVLTDLQMPGVSGLDFQDTLRARGQTMPIVFLTGHGDVPSTARAMREGAIDFLEKPVDESRLLDAITRALARASAVHERRLADRETAARLARLTKREREVGELVARGLLNKQIAFELGTSEKTVKVHRGRVMRKLEVDSVPALVRLFAGRADQR
jgi:FixJ family two-component response regulator